jgi:hypothetical protein
MRTEVHNPNDPAFDPLAVCIPAPVSAPPVQAAPAQPSATPAAEEQEETTLADTDSSYFGIHPMLPTAMAFADCDKLSVRPFRLKEKYKLGAARNSQQIRYVIEAVGACIDRSVWSLPLMDFWYICYWLRTQSYSRTPFTVSWACEDREHFRRVALGEDNEKTLINQTVLSYSDIQVRPLDMPALRELAISLSEAGVFLHVPTVADFVERIEHAGEWDPEFAFLVDLAVFIRPDRHGKTLAQRVEFLRALSDQPNGEAIVGDLLDAKALLEKGGTKETINASCKSCGVHQEVSLEVDLLTFFPFGI